MLALLLAIFGSYVSISYLSNSLEVNMHRTLTQSELAEVVEWMMKHAESAFAESKSMEIQRYWDGRADAYNHVLKLIDGDGFEKDITSEALAAILGNSLSK